MLQSVLGKHEVDSFRMKKTRKMYLDTSNMLQQLTGNQSSVLDKSKLAERTLSVHIVFAHIHFFGLIGLYYFNNNTAIEIQMRKQ